MVPFFYVDGGDLMCELGAETYKIAEVWTDSMEFETLEGLKEVYGDIPLTENILDMGMIFAEEHGYKVHY